MMDIVSAFLAVLEAVKNRLNRNYQNRKFGDIMIRCWEETGGVLG
jgi:segregation and condensation protein A